MPLSKPQNEIASCRSRFRVVVAGRRFGKTHLALRELCRFARHPGREVWYLCPTRQQAKGVLWSKLLKKLTKLNWIKSKNEADLSVTLVNGSIIALKSSEQGDALRGRSLAFCVIDEFCDVDAKMWPEIIRPSLSDQKGHALFIGTPKPGAEWAKALYDNGSLKTNWTSFTYTTIQGGNVSPEEVEQAREDLAPKVFSQEYEASWENFAGVILSEFGDHNLRKISKPTEKEPVYIGMDFNVNPMSAVIGRQTREGFEVYDEIYIENSNTQEMINEIRNRYPTNPVVVFPDPAGVQRKSSAGGNTDIKLLELAGFQTRYHRQHPLVRDRINAGNSLFFKRADGTTRFHIDPACIKTVRSFKNWSYREGTMIPDKDSGWDHACDAALYCLHYLYPIANQIKPATPQRFGVSLA